MHQICGHKRKDLLSNYDVGPEDGAMVWCMLYVVEIAILTENRMGRDCRHHVRI